METKATASMGRKVVRVVARVRSSADLSIQSTTSLLSVHKPKGDESETVSISFGDQAVSAKDPCKLDYCYEENETTRLIYTKEIKPLIFSVFEGKDASVIAQGARCSGKTHLIQGSEREPGVAVLTMAQMLSMAEERGDSISVSMYEVSQETVYDILDQEKRVISILEGAQGKIQLKGLSQVPIKSLPEFQSLCFSPKKFQKLTSDPPLRSHKGVMIHVTTSINSGSFGRMNFLDMAGYEDFRKQNNDLAPLETTRINKSIYALQNVLYALNANESHVPYRESKLTRMLKDCLQGCNRTLLITCLPSEFSQDSFHMLNLASRICLGSNRATKKKVARSISLSSTAQRRQTPLAATKKQTGLRGNVTERKTEHNPLAVSSATKKQTGAWGNMTERKTEQNTSVSAIKERKLFSEANDSVKRKNNSKKMEDQARMEEKKEISTSKAVLNVQDSSSQEEVCSSFIVIDSQSSLVEEGYSTSVRFTSEVIDTTIKETPQKHEERFSGVTYSDDGTASKAQVVERDDNNSEVLKDLTFVEEGENLDTKNNSLLANVSASQSLTMCLQEISNTVTQVVEKHDNKSAVEKDMTFVEEGKNLETENNSLLANVSASPPISTRLQELSNNLKSLCKPSNQSYSPENYHTALTKLQIEEVSEHSDITAEAVVNVELRTPERVIPPNIGCSPWKTFSAHSSKLKNSAIGEYLKFLNTADKEDLKKLKGIGEKRATYILELRGESPEPFKKLDDLKDIGLSEKQIKGLVRKEIGEIFN